MSAVDEQVFEFRSRLNLTLLTGLRARDLPELVQHMRTVPGAVIYHHTHHFLVQHQYLSPEPPNDFAYWVSNIIQEEQLGEQLASIDLLRFTTIRELRDALVGVIERFLEYATHLRTAPEGEEFHFMQAVSFVLPTGETVRNLTELRDGIERASLACISYHMFDARIRLERGDNDLSRWLDSALGEHKLAQVLREIDPYTHTEDGLRRRILADVNARLEELGRG